MFSVFEKKKTHTQRLCLFSRCPLLAFKEKMINVVKFFCVLKCNTSVKENFLVIRPKEQHNPKSSTIKCSIDVLVISIAHSVYIGIIYRIKLLCAYPPQYFFKNVSIMQLLCA